MPSHKTAINVKKAKVLFLAQLPPPIHGSSTMSRYALTSTLINSNFDTKHIDISSDKELTSLGTLNPKKVLLSVTSIGRIILDLAKFRPNLVHFVFHPFGLAFFKNLIIFFALKVFRVRTVLHLHCKGIRSNTKNPIKFWLYKLVFSNTSVILLDKLLLNDIKHVCPENHHIYFVPNGVEEVQKERIEKTKYTNEITFLFLSNLMPQKGAHDLIEAFSELQHELSIPLKLVIAGAVMNSPYDRKLHQLVHDNQLTYDKDISFVGQVTGAEKAAAFDQADVFILPTYDDCFPLVLLEAMSAGIPVISTKVGAIPNIITDGCGLVVAPGNIPELTSAMKVYCSSKKLLNEHSKGARERFLERYSKETFEKKLNEVLVTEVELSKE